LNEAINSLHKSNPTVVGNALLVKKLDPRALLPTVAHPGEDLGYDIYALEAAVLSAGKVTKVRTGIAVELHKAGFLMRERSSMAIHGITLSGGVIDVGYRGELFVNLLLHNPDVSPVFIEPGQKIAQIIPMRSNTFYPVIEVDQLSDSTRGENGYGSTGK